MNLISDHWQLTRSKLSLIKNSEIKEMAGNEGTKVFQYFHPRNTPDKIRCSLARFKIKHGAKSLRHKLKSSEIYYILSGDAELYIDGTKHIMAKNDSAYVPPMSEQFIRNTGTGDLEFLCIVEPAWKQEDEIILE